MTGNPEPEATLQRQRGLVLPNVVVFTNSSGMVGQAKRASRGFAVAALARP